MGFLERAKKWRKERDLGIVMPLEKIWDTVGILDFEPDFCLCCGLVKTFHWSGVCQQCQKDFPTYDDFLEWYIKNINSNYIVAFDNYDADLECEEMNPT